RGRQGETLLAKYEESVAIGAGRTAGQARLISPALRAQCCNGLRLSSCAGKLVPPHDLQITQRKMPWAAEKMCGAGSLQLANAPPRGPNGYFGPEMIEIAWGAGNPLTRKFG